MLLQERSISSLCSRSPSFIVLGTRASISMDFSSQFKYFSDNVDIFVISQWKVGFAFLLEALEAKEPSYCFDIHLPV